MKRVKTIAALLLVAAIVLTGAACRRDETLKSDTAQASQAAESEKPTQLLVEFDKLKGRWVRPDGGYVLELKELLPENRISAAYYNPSPINVGESKIYKENGFTKLFIKMQDQNYPGSTYTLIYDTENDKLCGIYYQATYGQQFQVEFTRMPPE